MNSRDPQISQYLAKTLVVAIEPGGPIPVHAEDTTTDVTSAAASYYTAATTRCST